MKKCSFIVFTLSLLVIPALPIQAWAESLPHAIDEPYRIHAGDVLEVSVWKEEDMSRVVIVRPDGAISFPLVDSVQAAGRTVDELRDEITQKMSRYIPDPVVTVATQQLLGNKVYVIGQVNRPGEIVESRYIDVVQALASAGGTTPYAADNKIKIIRRDEKGSLTAFEFRLGDIEKGKNLEQNIILQSGDVVVVP